MEQSNVFSVSTGSPVSPRGDRSIGALLIQAGRLTVEDNERILRMQRERNLRFGDAALKLGLLTSADIEFALSQQFNYPSLRHTDSNVSPELVAAYAASGPHLEALRGLRNQLMLRWFDNGPDHRTLAIISGERNEGRSFITANLAVVFSLLGKRTLLVDADMRNPTQHVRFGVGNRTGLSAVLSGRGGPETIQRISGLLDLSVLPAGATPPNPTELLSQSLFPQILNELGREYDVILLDSPAASECADAQAIAIRAGGALVVARKNATKMWRMRGTSESLGQTRATIVGTVLNDF